MTYNELKAQVASLGFERTVADDDSLLRATERALSIIHLDIPVTRKARIYVRAPRLTKVYKTIYHNGGEGEVYELSGDAFSFRPHGDGEYTLSDENATTRVKFYAGNGVVKGRISGRAKITFTGDTDYVITSLACFAGGFDISLSTVDEHKEFREISISDAIGDFASLAEKPAYVNDGTAVDKYTKGPTVSGDILYVPFEFCGAIDISYHPMPKSPARNSASLDLPMGTEQLFPLLVASFIWLDDDAGKAQYYMALYRDGINRLSRVTPTEKSEKYVTNGWA